MRKIPPQYENPIDHYYLHLVERLTPSLANTGWTPNQVTTLGNIIRLASLGFLLKGLPWLFLICALIGYFLDCVDGHLARSTDQESHFGDLYDHFSDIIYHIVLAVVVWRSSTFKKISLMTLLLVCGIWLFLFVSCLAHLGCQQRIYEKGDFGASLEILKRLCSEPKTFISITRHFGCGTFTLVTYLFIFFFFKN